MNRLVAHFTNSVWAEAFGGWSFLAVIGLLEYAKPHKNVQLYKINDYFLQSTQKSLA